MHQWILLFFTFGFSLLFLIKNVRLKLFIILILVPILIWGTHYGATSEYGKFFVDNKVKSQYPLLTGNEKTFNYYLNEIYPLFQDRCLQCHNSQLTQGGLNLETLEGVIHGGATGPVIVSGNKMQSSLYNRLVLPTQHPKHMPLYRGDLSSSEINKIGKWIDQGAFGSEPWKNPLWNKIHLKNKPIKSQKHWAFLKFDRPFFDSENKNNPIDFFLGNEKRNSNYKNYLFRVSYALTGLPPSQKEIKTFSSETSKSKLIDYFLNVPQYGEKWARNWMDLARYADSGGYDIDKDNPGSHFYRDQLIKSFNQDQPIDEFIRQQIAGDQLWPNSKSAKALSAFLLVGPEVLSSINPIHKYLFWDNMLSTTMNITLGLNFKCARCHNHKYDPISQENYYQMLNPFASVEKAYDGETDLAKVKFNPRLPILLHSLTKKDVVSIKLLMRGDINHPGPEIPFRLITFMGESKTEISFWENKIFQYYKNHKIDPSAAKERAILAMWLTDTKDGVGKFTARVFVDHVWRFHFGQGLVPSAGNFGMSGKAPLFPELLNYLTYSFIEHHWSLKYLQKLILQSQLYSSDLAPLNTSENDFLHLKFKRPLRLTAEEFRDKVLFVSGNLDKTMYGPGIPTQNFHQLSRRSLYLYLKRTEPYKLLRIINGPNLDETTTKRSEDFTLEQALYLLNDPFLFHQAQIFAQNLLKKYPHSTIKELLYSMTEIALGHKPNEKFKEIIHNYIAKNRTQKNLETLITYARTLFCLNEFHFIP